MSGTLLSICNIMSPVQKYCAACGSARSAPLYTLCILMSPVQKQLANCGDR